MSKVYIGIDPGLDGGIAEIWTNLEGKQIVRTNPIPLYTHKNKRMYNYNAIYSSLLLHNFDCIVLVEDTPFVPIKGMKGTNFSLNAIRSLSEFVGFVKGICIATASRGTVWNTISAKTWQKSLFANKSGDTKLLSIQFCGSVYPQLKPFTKSDRATKPHHGMCDALCIAHYAKNHY